MFAGLGVGQDAAVTECVRRPLGRAGEQSAGARRAVLGAEGGQAGDLEGVSVVEVAGDGLATDRDRDECAVRPGGAG